MVWSSGRSISISDDLEFKRNENMSVLYKLTEDKRIFAQFDDQKIRVYQAFNNIIADEAVTLGTFGSNFKLDRMTWIKPSFLWMMYRSGWASKEGQERILAIDINRTGFNNILENAVLSAFNAEVYEQYESWKELLETSQVRCQWDPDRDIFGNPLDRRAIQLGLKGSVINEYMKNWIVSVTDITNMVLEMRDLVKSNALMESMLPIEYEYPLDEKVKRVLGIIT